MLLKKQNISIHFSGDHVNGFTPLYIYMPMMQPPWLTSPPTLWLRPYWLGHAPTKLQYIYIGGSVLICKHVQFRLLCSPFSLLSLSSCNPFKPSSFPTFVHCKIFLLMYNISMFWLPPIWMSLLAVDRRLLGCKRVGVTSHKVCQSAIRL